MHYLANQAKGLMIVDLDPAFFIITPPVIKIDKLLKGIAVNTIIPTTCKVTELGDFRPISAIMYIYEDGKVIAQFPNMPYTLGCVTQR